LDSGYKFSSLNGDQVAAPAAVAAENGDGAEKGARKAASKERLLSLDIFRGLTVFIMILVNNGPYDAPPEHFAHVQWDGLALADIVMPFFLFMVGTSVVLAFRDVWPDPLADEDDEEDADKGARGWFVRPARPNRWEKVRRVVERTIKLFLLGLLCQGLRNNNLQPWPYVDLAVLRIMGVLQRIAIVYVVTALAFLFVPPLRLRRARTAVGRALQLGVRYLPLWAVGAVFAVVYNMVLFTTLVPNRYLLGEDRERIEIECNVRGELSQLCNAADYVDSVVRTPPCAPLCAVSAYVHRFV
jgi:heparan-alpha-glucosaminide N-acetyltransferase